MAAIFILYLYCRLTYYAILHITLHLLLMKKTSEFASFFPLLFPVSKTLWSEVVAKFIWMIRKEQLR